MTAPEPPRSTSYDGAFYDEISPYSFRAARVVVPIVADLVGPDSVLDVGCGAGAWLAVWQEHGVRDVLGLDGDYVDRARLHIDAGAFRSADLEHPPTLERTFDLATCIEVAEHLDPASAPRLVDLLTTAAPVVLFSAATPGQGGVDHVNEQWPAYWAELFAERGYRPFDIVRPRVWNDPDVAFFYAQNLVLYAADDRFASITPAFPVPSVDGHPAPYPLVHPGLFAALLAHGRRAPADPSLSSLVRRFPGALRDATARRVRAWRAPR